MSSWPGSTPAEGPLEVVLVAMKQSQNAVADDFYTEEKAGEHHQRTQNPFALQMLCPMLSTASRHYLVMEFALGGYLFYYIRLTSITPPMQGSTALPTTPTTPALTWL